MPKSKEFRRTAMPLIILNSILCTGLLEYFTDRITNAIGFAYLAFILISYCTTFCCFLDTMEIIWHSQISGILAFLLNFQFLINAAMFISTFIAGLVQRKKMRLFLTQLKNCAREMDELGIPGSYSALINHRHLVTLCFIGLLTAIVMSELMIIKSYTGYILIFAYCFTNDIPTVVSFTVDMTFAYWIRQVHNIIFIRYEIHLFSKRLGSSTIFKSTLTGGYDIPWRWPKCYSVAEVLLINWSLTDHL
ncbi:hypothetical protein KPH14_007310 [Odynerus spinipes]|uniref:Gustatory receptor n=1 Tax=Odynerus spinipes TaxID=1348599 RepID=A0AAD9RAT2_9HYME|nr:hypothetical protein KPH14_007310 [Odynerus spinipes]